MGIDAKESFGGKWSGAKLEALRAYLHAYTTALKHTSFKLAYIDAFAGAGLREVEDTESEDWFDEDFREEEERYRHGSPLIALANDPPFDAFIFIERDPFSIRTLQEQIENMWGEEGKKVSYLQGDANEHLMDLAEKNWKGHRAVAFLDPFALEVSWPTIEKIAETQAIDMWLLFPAMAVNRMLPKSGAVPMKWAERLTRLFGEENWREVFYPKEPANLFGEEVVGKVPKVFDALSAYVTNRLQTVFAGTHDKPLV
ncbi:MAG: three-Cys-motif partner protein TcmP [Verrucomicrobia bacterium]|nr:three-Cys-motif partner protein TcmP [Verrucomicrobiota bacterium]